MAPRPPPPANGARPAPRAESSAAPTAAPAAAAAAAAAREWAFLTLPAPAASSLHATVAAAAPAHAPPVARGAAAPRRDARGELRRAAPARVDAPDALDARVARRRDVEDDSAPIDDVLHARHARERFGVREGDERKAARATLVREREVDVGDGALRVAELAVRAEEVREVVADGLRGRGGGEAPDEEAEGGRAERAQARRAADAAAGAAARGERAAHAARPACARAASSPALAEAAAIKDAHPHPLERLATAARPGGRRAGAAALDKRAPRGRGRRRRR
jgi:hypothetical protein